jgi:hypothetical protein
LTGCPERPSYRRDCRFAPANRAETLMSEQDRVLRRAFELQAEEESEQEAAREA